MLLVALNNFRDFVYGKRTSKMPKIHSLRIEIRDSAIYLLANLCLQDFDRKLEENNEMPCLVGLTNEPKNPTIQFNCGN